MSRKQALQYSFLPALLTIALAVSSLPQTPDAPTQRPRKVFPAETEPADVLRFDTDLVSVDVTATDAEGRPVRNLRQQDFKLSLDGADQPVSFFHVERREGEPRPLAVVFALDVSGSMTIEEMETSSSCAPVLFFLSWPTIRWLLR
jgi:hypothetical protein